MFLSPSENRKLYGRDITNKEILATGDATFSGGRSLVAILNRYSPGPVTSASIKETLRTSGGRLTLGEKEIHFATGQATLPPEAESLLSDVATTLKTNRSWKLRVEGYTDNVGSKTSNQQLSEKRAGAVAAWLQQHGIAASRLTQRGYGEAHPVADNSTEEGRTRNRRVELVRR